MQQITAKCKAVGKYKSNFNSTGLLLEWNGETWVDLPGQLNWKDYKDKTLTLNVEQNNKGYWSGTEANPFQQPSTSQQAPQMSQPQNNKDMLIARQSSIRSACELLKGGSATPADVIDYAEFFVEYVIKGKQDMGRRIDDLV